MLFYDLICLKQSAILVAHHIAEGKSEPKNVIDYDTHFTSKLFEIQSSKAMIKAAEKERNDVQAEIYQQRLDDAHRLADEYKAKIQDIFHSTFEA